MMEGSFQMVGVFLEILICWISTYIDVGISEVSANLILR